MKKIVNSLMLRLTLTLLACIALSVSYASSGDEPGAVKKGGPAETTADLLKRRLLLQRLNSQGGDPLYFMLRSNKTEVKPGEEVELTISVHLLQDAHKTFIVYEELFGYTLRLTMPEGFVVTGGNYHDLLRDRVTRRDPVKTYTVTGYFEEECENCEFKLLRGTYYHNSQENMVYKTKVSIQTLSGETLQNSPLKHTNGNEIISNKTPELLQTVATNAIDSVEVLELVYTDACNPTGPFFNLILKNHSSQEQRIVIYYSYDGTSGIIEHIASLPPGLITTVPTAIPLDNTKQIIRAHIRNNEVQKVGNIYPNIGGKTSNYIYIASLPGINFRIANIPPLGITRNAINLIPVGCPAGSLIHWSIDGALIKSTREHDAPFTYQFTSSGTKEIRADCYTSTSGYSTCGHTYTTNIIVTLLCTNLTPQLQASGFNGSNIEVIRGNPVGLSVSGCTSDIVWKKDNSSISGENKNSYSANLPGTYTVTCSMDNCANKTSNSITITHNGKPKISYSPPTLAIHQNETVYLKADGCTYYEWGPGINTNTYPVTGYGPGTYSVRCVSYDKSIFSEWESITFTLLEPNAPLVYQEDASHCLREGEKKKIFAGCSSQALVDWVNPNLPLSSQSYSEISVGSGIYTVKCCLNGTCGPEASITVCGNNSNINCENLIAPTVAITSGNIKMGDFFELKISGCTDSVTWYKDYVVYKTGVETIYSNEKGTYHATCYYNECKQPIPSNFVTPFYSPFTISHNVPNNEVVSGVPFELRAVGCADGMVEWYTAAGTTRYENPIWESSPGTYRARCIKDGDAYSDWVYVHFTLRSATTPQFSKPDQCFYANQNLYISGTCPTGMTLRWNDGSTATSFPAYKQVTPGTYSAQCCNGSNCSAIASVTVCTITPNIQQINTDKDDPMTGIGYAAPNEPVLLTATGCDYGTVQWTYGGQTQWGNPVTVYGPGKYYARCFVTDHSTSPMISREIYPRAPGSVAIIPSQSTAFQGQMLTLTATGCNGGQIHWTYTEAGKTYNLSGRSIDVVGPNTYYAKCIVYGDTGPQSSITIPQSSGIPKITTDKSRVRPNETFTFQVDFSSCPGYGWPGGSTLVTQDGVTATLWGWDPITLTGPAVLEARCENASWAKQTKEIFLAPGDNMRLVANKAKAKYNENVLLTTYGCDFGYVEWKIGDNMILGHELDPKRQVTQTGPGFYKARCKNDFMVNSDWVTTYVELDGSIVPVINGPNSLCPNTAATITTAGCPSGYYNSWSTLEQGGFSYGGNSVTVYLPQTVKLRCIKNDNSWGSDEKPLTIVSAIPDDIKVTSNSPVVSGGTALLTGTSVSGATYLWTPPAGVTLPVLNTRDLQIPNVTSAYSGEYKLKVSSGGCQVEVSARVDVDLCDNLYIKAFDPTSGDEKTRLNRKPGQLNLYDDLVLQVETFDGEILKGVEYTWTLPQGVTAGQDPAQQHKITINKIGNYKVNVTSTGGVTCPLEVDISALACATPADFLNCGSTSTVSSTGTEKLKNLAVGDVFSTYDYVVSVTEVSGSESTGWTGRGYIEMSFLKLGATALSVPLAVRFNNIHLNQCYQLLPGSKVITEFDPTWSNIVDVDVITDRLSAVYAEIKDILATNPEDKQALQKKVDELNTIKTDLATSGFRPDWITQQTTALDGVIDGTSCLINSANLRSTNSCSPDDVKGSLNNAESVMSNSSVIPLYGDVFDESGNYVSSTNNPNGHNLVLIRTLSLTYRPLNDYIVLSGKENVINKIFMHYWNDLGYSSALLKNNQFTVKKREKNDTGDLATSCVTNEIFIYKEHDNIIRRGLHYKEYLRSSLYHEWFHLVQRKGCPVNYSTKMYEEHIDVYYKQFSKSDFKEKMDPEWIKGLYRTCVDELITPYGITYPAKAQEWKNKFKALNLGL